MVRTMMARKSKAISNTDTPQYRELPEHIIVNEPLVDVQLQSGLFVDAPPQHYTLEYNTYGSIHIVGVWWDGERLTPSV